MKRILSSALALSVVVLLIVGLSSTATAQEKQAGKGQRGALFVDKDGDGVCDNVGTKAGAANGEKQNRARKGKSYGPGDGTGNKGVGPQDGTGYGAKNSAGTGTGTGTCDGTGPKGSANRAGRR